MNSEALITTDIDLAVRALAADGVVAIPTETVYGLAARATSDKAVRRVFDIKNRPYDHPLIVHLSPDADVNLWGVFNKDAEALAQTCWPGPLTILVPRTTKVSDIITGGRTSVAIRVPAHPMAQLLLSRLDDGVVAPSANTFGHVSPTTAQHVVDDLGSLVDLILDGGSCSVGIESTIVDCTTDQPQIVRPGVISHEEIQMIISSPLAAASGPSRAPGMLASHYSPRIPVELTDTFQEAEDLQKSYSQRNIRVALISYTESAMYALNLYRDLRQAEDDECDRIIAVLPAPHGIGVAVRDRLIKAAAPKTNTAP
jgi:L-threonylcarbamoyladenylate synthase